MDYALEHESATLEAQGYLLKKINGKSYMPGNRLYDMAVGVLAHSRFRAERHAILQSLSEDIGETCNIAYPDGIQMAYSDRVETQWPLRLVQIPVGTRVPLHCTASGKLYLSTLPLCFDCTPPLRDTRSTGVSTQKNQRQELYARQPPVRHGGWCSGAFALSCRASCNLAISFRRYRRDL